MSVESIGILISGRFLKTKFIKTIKLLKNKESDITLGPMYLLFSHTCKCDDLT